MNSYIRAACMGEHLIRLPLPRNRKIWKPRGPFFTLFCSDRPPTGGEQLRQASDRQRAAPTGLRQAESSSDRPPTGGEQLRQASDRRRAAPTVLRQAERSTGRLSACRRPVRAVLRLSEPLSACQRPVGAALRLSEDCQSRSPPVGGLSEQKLRAKCTSQFPYPS